MSLRGHRLPLGILWLSRVSTYAHFIMVREHVTPFTLTHSTPEHSGHLWDLDIPVLETKDTHSSRFLRAQTLTERHVSKIEVIHTRGNRFGVHGGSC